MTVLYVLFFTIPLIIPFLTPLFSTFNKKFGSFISPLIYIGGFVVGILIYPDIMGENIVLNLGGWTEAFAINLVLSPVSLGGGLLIYFIAFLIGIYDVEKERPAYYNMLYNLFIFANLIMIMTTDFFNLFVMMEISAIATIALIAKNNQKLGSRGAVKYIIVSSIASLILLTSIGLLYSATGKLSMPDIIQNPSLNPLFGFLIGIGIMVALFYHAELFPLNSWVPDAYNGSSYSFAGTLGGIGSLTGGIVLGRIMLTVMNSNSPFSESMDGLLLVLLIVGTLSVLIGELGALREKNIKKMLSYSSIGQLGLVAIAFRIGGDVTTAGIFILLNHSLVKALLFILSGHFSKISGSNNWEDMKGIGRVHPILVIIFIIGSLSLMGIPLFMGFWGKIGLLSGIVKGFSFGGTFMVTMIIAFAVILISTIIEGAYLMKVSHTFFEKEENIDENSENGIKKDVDLSVLFITIVIALLILFIGVYPGPIKEFLDNAARDLINIQGYVNILQGSGV